MEGSYSHTNFGTMEGSYSHTTLGTMEGNYSHTTFGTMEGSYSHTTFGTMEDSYSHTTFPTQICSLCNSDTKQILSSDSHLMVHSTYHTKKVLPNRSPSQKIWASQWQEDSPNSQKKWDELPKTFGFGQPSPLSTQNSLIGTFSKKCRLNFGFFYKGGGEIPKHPQALGHILCTTILEFWVERGGDDQIQKLLGSLYQIFGELGHSKSSNNIGLLEKCPKTSKNPGGERVVRPVLKES